MNGSRYAYLGRVCELVGQGEDMVVVSADYAAPVFDKFRVEHPTRFLSVGIAEQNLIAVSCGLALCGKRVIAYGLAPFPLLRALDQIKNAASMMQAPINVVIAGTGFGVPEWGATHYNIDDMSIIRPIPNVRIITPSDNPMGIAAAEYALINKTPVYVRFDKYAEGVLYDKTTFDLDRGFSVLRNGKDVAVVSCGSFVERMLRQAEAWERDGVSARVIDLYGCPGDEDAFCQTIGELPILTVEEHVLPGGIGSVILEMLNNRSASNRVKRLGVVFDGRYPQTSGSREYYLGKFGLSEEAITGALFEFLREDKQTR